MSLKAARGAVKPKGLTQVQLAAASGISQRTISDIEVAQDAGLEPNVTLATARALKEALQKRGLKKLTLDDLFPEAR